ncbi:hypothetical protein G7084_00455 [Weissella coleopterorum]|uniref:Uncharacterized protein n=1 Tax=Weissella coleopterorum TaxID=2714949 RepID=A0A6G8AY91_9LACO|nr:hypothetical protein [Weissella coleopterorum]QIL49929.1 hypothetical protein G7084_00455 [Weissella coleopterorum]
MSKFYLNDWYKDDESKEKYIFDPKGTTNPDIIMNPKNELIKQVDEIETASCANDKDRKERTFNERFKKEIFYENCRHILVIIISIILLLFILCIEFVF